MAIILSQGGIPTYGTKEFAVATASEITSLPTNIQEGSVAMVIATGDVYMLIGGAWTKVGT